MKEIRIDLPLKDYELIKDFSNKSNSEIHEYIKRSLVLMMNLDDLMTSKDSYIRISDGNINRVITRKQIEYLK